MSQDGSGESRFWQWAAVRLVAIVFVGWASVLWFQGCLVPSIKDEVRHDQQKAADTTDAR
jgi:hypothetical protein